MLNKRDVDSKSSKDQLMRHDEIPADSDDPLLNVLHKSIRFGVRVLAILMVLVIYWSIVDVVYVIYERLQTPPYMLMDVEDILQVFGAFMAVLIAIEIFINIRLYLGSNVIPVQLVIATALMAIARKVIVLDLTLVSAEQIVGIGITALALGICYWLVRLKP
jgi:uncharacterized membrane protein (DUF373 family)